MLNKKYEEKLDNLEKKIYFLRKEFMVYIEQMQAMILEVQTALEEQSTNE